MFAPERPWKATRVHAWRQWLQGRSSQKSSEMKGGTESHLTTRSMQSNIYIYMIYNRLYAYIYIYIVIIVIIIIVIIIIYP